MGRKYDEILAASTWGRGRLAARTAQDLHALRLMEEAKLRTEVKVIWSGTHWITSDGKWWWTGGEWQAIQAKT